MGYQHTVIQGNVGKDPEQRQVGQSTVASFSVAVSEHWTDSNGEKKEATTWYRVSAWNKQAALVMKYVQKGDKVLCDGSVEAKAYMGSDGQPKASLDLRLKTIQFLGGGSNQQQQSQGQQDPNDMPF